MNCRCRRSVTRGEQQQRWHHFGTANFLFFCIMVCLLSLFVFYVRFRSSNETENECVWVWVCVYVYICVWNQKLLVGERREGAQSRCFVWSFTSPTVILKEARCVGSSSLPPVRYASIHMLDQEYGTVPLIFCSVAVKVWVGMEGHAPSIPVWTLKVLLVQYVEQCVMS